MIIRNFAYASLSEATLILNSSHFGLPSTWVVFVIAFQLNIPALESMDIFLGFKTDVSNNWVDY
jgi:hypothetical protein